MTVITENLTAIPAADVARFIRKELKSAFPGIKFSVSSTRSGWAAEEGRVRVAWVDGPTADKVEAITKKYEGIRLEMDVAGYWGSERIANEDGTYFAVGTVDTERSMSNETHARITATAISLSGASNLNDFNRIVAADELPSSVYSAFHNRNNTSISFHYNAWDFINWAFRSKDVAAS